MEILCDTSSALMLIRIGPSMFMQKRYGCCTTKEVRREIFGTQKFKTKYAWRDEYKDKVRCVPNELSENEDVIRYFDVITSLLEVGIINQKTGRDFDLSYTDRKIVACVLSNGYKLTSGDSDLKEFASQEFGSEFRGSISPLGIINRWLKKELLRWNSKRHLYLADWNKNEEHKQPLHQIKQFRRLTGLKYPGK